MTGLSVWMSLPCIWLKRLPLSTMAGSVVKGLSVGRQRQDLLDHLWAANVMAIDRSV